MKLADTLHGATIGLVVNVLPTNVPPHVPVTAGVKFALAVTVKVFVAPTATNWTADGLMTPPDPELGVTAYAEGVNVAATEHGAIIGFVVKVVPISIPPHDPPTVALKLALGVTVRLNDDPWTAI